MQIQSSSQKYKERFRNKFRSLEHLFALAWSLRVFLGFIIIVRHHNRHQAIFKKEMQHSSLKRENDEKQFHSACSSSQRPTLDRNNERAAATVKKQNRPNCALGQTAQPCLADDCRTLLRSGGVQLIRLHHRICLSLTHTQCEYITKNNSPNMLSMSTISGAA